MEKEIVGKNVDSGKKYIVEIIDRGKKYTETQWKKIEMEKKQRS